MLLYFALLPSIAAAPAAPAPAAADEPAALSCEALSSSALSVSWPCVDATDLYYVALFATAAEAGGETPKPAAILTSQACHTVLEDLLPSTTYYLRVRSHPTTAPSTVWGWRNYSSGPSLGCATKAALAYTVQRHGALMHHQLGFQWRANAGHELGLARGEITALWRHIPSGVVASVLRRPLGTVDSSTWQQATLASTGGRGDIATVAGLSPDSSYAALLRGPNGATLSDPIRLRTAAVGSSYETVYRVAEGTHDIDLLLNHNAGDLQGEAAFLSDSGNYKLTPQQISNDPCAQALNRTECVPNSGGCMTCAGSVWVNGTGAVADAVRKQCSNPALPFPTDNKAAENWCGDGFAFFDWTLTPVTEYWCAEPHSPLSSFVTSL
eukprot:COSAG02_NODE_732_length_17973_cov_6.920275_9_plen_382_part_00